jgi:biopolymer transport protein TolR
MKHALLLSILATAVMSSTAQSPAPPSISTPTLRPGISVKLPITHNAAELPDADNEDAFVIAVTRDGTMYRGTQRIDSAELSASLKAVLSHNRGANFYLKSDARTPYSVVLNALAAARSAGAVTPFLLTSQGQPPQPPRPVPPVGLQVLVSAPPTGAQRITVQLESSGAQTTAKINAQSVSWNDLPAALNKLARKGNANVVLLKADAKIPLQRVVEVVDACRPFSISVALM